MPRLKRQQRQKPSRRIKVLCIRRRMKPLLVNSLLDLAPRRLQGCARLSGAQPATQRPLVYSGAHVRWAPYRLYVSPFSDSLPLRRTLQDADMCDDGPPHVRLLCALCILQGWHCCEEIKAAPDTALRPNDVKTTRRPPESSIRNTARVADIEYWLSVVYLPSRNLR
jgi:hypothetical protein